MKFAFFFFEFFSHFKLTVFDERAICRIHSLTREMCNTARRDSFVACGLALYVQMSQQILILKSIFSLTLSEWSYSVTGVEGNLIELPCNASTTKDGDDVKLVLWFKNGSNKPIYT